MRHVISFALSLFALSAAADERSQFLGEWGTPAQCARALLVEGGTVHAEPFAISTDWLKHGQIWCSLRWFPLEESEGRAFTGAFARCGEDAVRTYFLRMKIKDDALTLHWDLFQKNGPLMRCTKP